MFISWLHFLAMLLLTGLALRYVTSMFPEKDWAKAIAFIY